MTDCCERVATLERTVVSLQHQLLALGVHTGSPPPIPVLGVASIFHASYLLRCIRSIDFAVETLVVVHNGDDPDVGAAIELAERSAKRAGRPAPRPMYLGRICYTAELLEGQRRTLSYVLMDSPRRVLRSLGLDEDHIVIVEQAARTNNPGHVDPLVTEELLHRYQITGTPKECEAEVARMVTAHNLHAVLIDALSMDLDENLSVISNSLPIIKGTLT